MTEPRKSSGIVLRTVLMTSIVAFVAVLLAGLISYPLVRAAAQTQAQSTLSRLADVTAMALASFSEHGGRGDRDPVPPQVAQSLNEEQVTVYLVGPEGSVPPGVSVDQQTALRAGQSISTQADIASGFVFIEGRPLPNGYSIVLEQPGTVTAGPIAEVLKRLALALLVGLVLAILVGYFAAARIHKSLRQAADAANAMSAGARDVRVEPTGPREVAAIATSLNALASNLSHSEERQREFLLSVSHEFRTPLTAIRGYGEAMADGIVEGDDVPRTGSIVAGEAERLDRLVSDLLDLARLGAVDFAVHPVEVDLGILGAEAAAVWADRCEREGVSYSSHIASVSCVTDPMRLRQIIDNLTENALRVTPAGSVIVLEIRRDGPVAVVEVRDGGPGLMPEDIAAAFEPGVLYERYKGVRKVGTGFGLALVGSLASGLGGTATAGHAPEGGASFMVRIPCIG